MEDRPATTAEAQAAAREAITAARAANQRAELGGAPAGPVAHERRRELANEVLDFLQLVEPERYAEHVEDLVYALGAMCPMWLAGWLADRRSTVSVPRTSEP